ncbi:hypothetical protein [Oenococcus oeni]|nr:hypothetical protein [Oenococcus oeni]
MAKLKLSLSAMIAIPNFGIASFRLSFWLMNQPIPETKNEATIAAVLTI